MIEVILLVKEGDGFPTFEVTLPWLWEKEGESRLLVNGWGKQRCFVAKGGEIVACTSRKSANNNRVAYLNSN